MMPSLMSAMVWSRLHRSLIQLLDLLPTCRPRVGGQTWVVDSVLAQPVNVASPHADALKTAVGPQIPAKFAEEVDQRSLSSRRAEHCHFQSEISLLGTGMVELDHMLKQRTGGLLIHGIMEPSDA